jgi:ABC-type antimicrobial peptide transport system permease subunit
MALGQPTPSLVKMVVREGLQVALAGTALGVVGAITLGRMLSSLLFETSANDMMTFLGVSLIFIVVAGTACLLPTWRVTLIDPFEALRQE